MVAVTGALGTGYGEARHGLAVGAFRIGLTGAGGIERDVASGTGRMRRAVDGAIRDVDRQRRSGSDPFKVKSAGAVAATGTVSGAEFWPWFNTKTWALDPVIPNGTMAPTCVDEL